MEYKLSNGTVLTDEDIERLAEDIEKNGLPGKPGKFIIAPPGRPRLSEEELVTVAFKIPRSQRDKLDDVVDALGKKRSEFLRDALEAALERELAARSIA
ncbi:MAG: hypothetical protein IJ125_01000 [Atopobiaceae bacterium]|nr:hypothetical protein [Atopobiaceae bacterium]